MSKEAVEEIEREHEKDLLALEQEIEGWKAANRILKAHLEQAEKALECVANSGARETMRRYAEEALKAIREE